MEDKIINKYIQKYGKVTQCSVKDIKQNIKCIYMVDFNGTPKEYQYLKDLKDQPVLLKVPKKFNFNNMVKELKSDFYDIHSRHINNSNNANNSDDTYFIHTIVKSLYESFFGTQHLE